MAVIQNPIIGKARKSMANAVFSTWKTINTLRSKPLTVTNPKTPAQVLQRSKMTYMVATFRQISNVVNVGFIEQAIKKSSYNAFVQENITKLPNVPPFVPDASFKVAKGSLRAPQALVLDNISASNCDVSWSTALLPGDNPNDIFYCVIWNSDDNTYTQYPTTASRADGTVNIVFYGTQQAQGTLFGFFVAPDLRKSSDSQFLDLV